MNKYNQAKLKLSQITGLSVNSAELTSKINAILKNIHNNATSGIDPSLLATLKEITIYGEVYKDAGYTGESMPLLFEEYPRLRRWNFNDKISSVHTYADMILFCENDYYDGRRLLTFADIDDFTRVDFNDITSSIKSWFGTTIPT
jgi:hypothetical protein